VRPLIAKRRSRRHFFLVQSSSNQAWNPAEDRRAPFATLAYEAALHDFGTFDGSWLNVELMLADGANQEREKGRFQGIS
jgi:hypothetical protein